MAVPVRSCHRLGDLGQAAEGLATPDETLLQDHDPLEPPLPFSHEQGAGLQTDALSPAVLPEDMPRVVSLFEAHPTLPAVLLVGHGIVAVGENVLEAEHVAELVEETAQIAWLQEVGKKVFGA